MKTLYAYFSRIMYALTFPFTSVLLHNSKRVRVLVFCNNQILLQKSSLGHQKWSVPGGGIEKNENPLNAAIRETLEETGVAINESQLVYLGQQRVSSRKRWPMVDMVFYKVTLSEFQETHITRPLEIIDSRWFNVNSLPKDASKTLEIALAL